MSTAIEELSEVIVSQKKQIVNLSRRYDDKCTELKRVKGEYQKIAAEVSAMKKVTSYKSSIESHPHHDQEA